MQDDKKVFGIILYGTNQEEWGYIIANDSSKKLEIIKYSFTGEEIPIITIPFYSDNIEEKIQKETGEDVYVQTAFPSTNKEYPGWVLR